MSLPGQVKSESQLRYGPQLADLLAARHTNYHQYRNDVQTAQDVSQATKRAAQQAIPQLAAIYHQADATRKDAGHQIELAIQGTGDHGALALALRGESAAAAQQSASAQAVAKAEQVQRGSDAVAGLAFSKRNALENFRAGRSDLMAQTRGIHGQMGAFATSRLADLQAQQATQEYKASKDAQAQSNSDRTYNLQVAKARGLDPVTGKPLKKNASNLGIKPLTTTQNDSVLNGIQEAQSWVKNLSSSAHMKPADIVGHLVRGDTLTDANGNKLKLPKLPKPLVAAAFDLNTNGYLSAPTTQALITRGVKLPQSWKAPTTPGGAATVLSGTLRRNTRKLASQIKIG